METDMYSVLKDYWGYEQFRPLQKEIILSILDHQDTLALLPTGGGKSLCFQIPSLMMEGICIVVSPLIALMKDQVEHLKHKNIKAEALHSGMSYREVDILLDNCIYGDIKFLYVSPERLQNELFIERFKKMKVNLIAVDEAHCISQWGYDFRPSYLEIGKLREIHPKVDFIALTATATTKVVNDIQEQLLFKKKNVLRKSFRRENLAYVVLKENNKMQRLLDICSNIKGTGIIYVRNRKKTKEITSFLKHKGINANFYHAGLKSEIRSLRQEQWKQGKIRIIVSTNAFGMGIDKPDVRFVVHLDIPESIEAYFQEAGRGGRDGKKAYAVLLWNEADVAQLDKNLELSFPAVEFLQHIYTKVVRYLRLPTGSALNETYDFDIFLFAKKHDFGILKTFNALKLLEKEGYFQLNYAVLNPSKITFLVEKRELYKFQVSAKRYDGFIKLLLRSYSGLFDNYVAINEALLANRSQTSRKKISLFLDKLKQRNIIDYKPVNQKPSITFLKEVADINHLYIDRVRYKTLKKQKADYIASIREYVLNEDSCRESILLKYFGEIADTSCGECDFCIEEKRREEKRQRDLKAERKVLNLLSVRAQTPDNIMKVIKTLDEKQIKELIRRLMDNGKVKFDEAGKVYLTMD